MPDKIDISKVRETLESIKKMCAEQKSCNAYRGEEKCPFYNDYYMECMFGLNPYPSEWNIIPGGDVDARWEK